MRSGPSGPFEQQRERLDWDMAATVALTVQPAGHEPGQYLVSGVAIVRVPPLGQNLDRQVTFAAPNGAGAQVVLTVAPFGVTSGPGTYGVDATMIQSDGSAPIVVSFIPNGPPDPATLVDLYTAATLQTSRG